LGANGAGKSTLLNVIGGTVTPDQGELWISESPVDLSTYGPLRSRRAGVQRVFQELSVFQNLSVTANFSLTAESGTKLNKRLAQREARHRLDAVFPGNGISPRAELAAIPLAQRQMVEIARSSTERSLKVLILDEPTSALSAKAASQLGDYLRRRAAGGLSIIYVTHKLDEALQLCDRIVVLRDGKLHWEGDGPGLTRETLLTHLGAAPEPSPVPEPDGPAVAGGASHLLTVKLPGRDQSAPQEVTVGQGEIVGLAGLEGAGQRPLLRAVFQHRRFRRRQVDLHTSTAYVSGDRQREGVLPLWTVLENVGVSALRRTSTAGFVNRRRNQSIAMRWLEELGLQNRAHSLVGELSGGNQQRALFGRALASDAGLLLLDDPTRGVDAAAKGDIYEMLKSARADGKSALFYSTENAEFQQCDRVYVMADGALSAEFTGEAATEERIVHASYAAAGQDTTDQDRQQSYPAWLASAWPIAKRALRWGPMPAAILFLAMLGTVFTVQPNATNPAMLNMLLQSSTVMAAAAMAQMMFILGGDFDLGLGFAIGFVNVVAATLLTTNPALGVAALVCVVAGYILMALLVEKFGIPSVVVTLGASFVWLGLGMLLQQVPGGSAPKWLTGLIRIKTAPIPQNAWVLIGLAALGILIVSVWRFSIILKALGANRRTLSDLGYSTARARIILYVVAALFVVVAGLLVAAHTTSSDINASSALTLSSVAAVIVGGASFSGGRVFPLGAVLAAVGLSLISSLLVFIGVNSQYSTAVGGIVLIAVLALRAVTDRGAK
jgi:ribose transport system ATP-binding protein